MKLTPAKSNESKHKQFHLIQIFFISALRIYKYILRSQEVKQAAKVVDVSTAASYANVSKNKYYFSLTR